MSSLTFSDKAVSAILPRFGSPRSSDSARCTACSEVTLAEQRRFEGIYHRLQNGRLGLGQELLPGPDVARQTPSLPVNLA